MTIRKLLANENTLKDFFIFVTTIYCNHIFFGFKFECYLFLRLFWFLCSTLHDFISVIISSCTYQQVKWKLWISRLKALAGKLAFLSLIPKSHVGKGNKWILEVVVWLPHVLQGMCVLCVQTGEDTDTYMCTATHRDA